MMTTMMLLMPLLADLVVKTYVTWHLFVSILNNREERVIDELHDNITNNMTIALAGGGQEFV